MESSCIGMLILPQGDLIFEKRFKKFSRNDQILFYGKDSVEISLRVSQLIFFARSLLELARLKAVKIPATSSIRCICIRIISVKWLVIDGPIASSLNRIRTDSLLPHSNVNNALSIEMIINRESDLPSRFFIYATHDTIIDKHQTR